MPELKVEIAEQLPKPIEGGIYTIATAEVFVSQVRSYKGIRVGMVGTDGKPAVEVLWLRDVAGEKSKLGSFVKCLGNNTDSWISRKIRFVEWRQNTRKIEAL